MIKVDMGNDGYTVGCRVNIDGDQYCVQGIDWNFTDMPAGFGDTVGQAVANFKSKLRNEIPCSKQMRPKNAYKTT